MSAVCMNRLYIDQLLDRIRTRTSHDVCLPNGGPPKDWQRLPHLNTMSNHDRVCARQHLLHPDGNWCEMRMPGENEMRTATSCCACTLHRGENERNLRASKPPQQDSVTRYRELLWADRVIESNEGGGPATAVGDSLERKCC